MSADVLDFEIVDDPCTEFEEDPLGVEPSTMVQVHWAQERFRSDGQIGIGREGDNEVVVDDPMASRFHCRIRRIGKGLYIEDLGSFNGTFVGRRRVRSLTRISEHDVIRVGATQICLQLIEAPRRQEEPVEATVAFDRRTLCRIRLLAASRARADRDRNRQREPLAR
jgi:predicted component of type VI protein secretion system